MFGTEGRGGGDGRRIAQSGRVLFWIVRFLLEPQKCTKTFSLPSVIVFLVIIDYLTCFMVINDKISLINSIFYRITYPNIMITKCRFHVLRESWMSQNHLMIPVSPRILMIYGERGYLRVDDLYSMPGATVCT